MTQQQELGELAGQYLTFMAGNELFAIDILRVNEIIEVDTMTRVPRAPEFIRGVINLRGGVIPVVDLAARLGAGITELTRRSCIILVGVPHAGREQIVGLLVDEVREIIDIGPADLRPPPDLGGYADTGFIQAMAQVGQMFIILLHVAEILTHHEINQASAVAERLSGEADQAEPIQ